MRKEGPKPAIQDLDVRLTQIELQIENVRTLYEQYFAGVLKRAPLREHDQLKSALQSIPPHELKVTASRFRFQSLKTRFLNLSNLWAKTLREIEEGTYRRDLFLLKAKEKEPTTQSKPASEPRASTASPKTSSQLEAVYQKFAEIASAQNQKIPSKETFVKALQTQIDAQKAKNPGAKFEIKVQKDEAGKFQVRLKVNRTT